MELSRVKDKVKSEREKEKLVERSGGRKEVEGGNVIEFSLLDLVPWSGVK